MSQVETNPVVSPTITVNNPNQIMQVKPAVQITNFSFEGIPMVRTQRPPFTLDQMDWIKLAEKNKYIATFTWNLVNTGNIYVLELTPAFIRTLIPTGFTQNTFFDYDTVMFSIKSSANAFYQGYSLVCYDPAPFPTYNEDILGRQRTPNDYWQYQNVKLSPKTSGEINFTIPLIYLLDKFKNNHNQPDQASLDNYMGGYSLGRIIVHVLAPLATTSAITSQKYTISGQVLDLRTSGTIVSALS